MSHCEQEGKGKIKLTVKKLCKTLTVEIYLVPNAYIDPISILNAKHECYKVISSVASALRNYWQTERKRDERYVFSFLIYAKIIYWLWEATPMTHLKCQSCFVNNQLSSVALRLWNYWQTDREKEKRIVLHQFMQKSGKAIQST